MPHLVLGTLTLTPRASCAGCGRIGANHPATVSTFEARDPHYCACGCKGRTLRRVQRAWLACSYGMSIGHEREIRPFVVGHETQGWTV